MPAIQILKNARDSSGSTKAIDAAIRAASGIQITRVRSQIKPQPLKIHIRRSVLDLNLYGA